MRRLPNIINHHFSQTPEAALTKMAYILSKKDLNNQEKKKWMEANLVGEMTVIKIERGHQLTKAISTESLNSLSGGEDDNELDLIQAISKVIFFLTLVVVFCI